MNKDIAWCAISYESHYISLDTICFGDVKLNYCFVYKNKNRKLFNDFCTK